MVSTLLIGKTEHSWSTVRENRAQLGKIEHGSERIIKFFLGLI